MNINVIPSATASKAAVRVDIDGHFHDVFRDDMPPNLPPLVRLAADTFWRSGAEGHRSYRVVLLED